MSGCGIETENVTESKTRLAPQYKVLLHNDDYNAMHDVVRALCETFRFKTEEAALIMMEAHSEGVALCKIEPLEHAELHRDQLQAQGLIATIEPAD